MAWTGISGSSSLLEDSGLTADNTFELTAMSGQCAEVMVVGESACEDCAGGVRVMLTDVVESWRDEGWGDGNVVAALRPVLVCSFNNMYPSRGLWM